MLITCFSCLIGLNSFISAPINIVFKLKHFRNIQKVNTICIHFLSLLRYNLTNSDSYANKNMELTPIISVIVTTYNQEKYIAEALEGIFLQKDCPKFEVIIGNDCSTDLTGKIIEDYRKKYPEIIKVLPRPKNLGMQLNLKNCIENCIGEYIAICEGDDYWIDCYKLKKQYELLKKSENSSFCFNDIYIKNEITGNKKLKRHFKTSKKKLPTNITFENLIEYRNPVANFSCCMYKKDALKYLPETYWSSKAADFLFHMYLLDNSTGIFLKDICSVYRINNNSIYASQEKEQKISKQIENIVNYNKIFENKYKKSFYILLQKTLRDLLKEKILFSVNLPFCKKKISLIKSAV